MGRKRSWLAGALSIALVAATSPAAVPAAASERAASAATAGSAPVEASAAATTERAAVAGSGSALVRSVAAQQVVARPALDRIATAASTQARARVGDAIADRLLVTFRADVPAVEAQTVLDAAGVHGEAMDGYRVAVADVHGDPVAAIARLAASPEVVSVDLDQLLAFRPMQDAGTTAPAPDAAPASVNTADDGAAVDPLRGAQWWWHNEGQQVQGSSGFAQVGLPGMDIGAKASWAATRGRPEVVVAVVDTGVDIDHPDLRANLWRNSTVGAFGCQDDLHGCDFSGPQPRGQVYSGDADEDKHGTHIAGIVAAAEDGAGIVGVAPRVRIMSVKFLRGEEGSVGAGIRAIQYATRAGADVINASWAVPGTPARHAALDQALRDARVAVVTAAGNDGQNMSDPESAVMPASSRAPNVITVTAFDNRGVVPSFANWSTTDVDVAAPGYRILSTLPEGAYGYLNGTSQAAPAVAGIAALAVSATRNNDGARIARAIRTGARPFGPLDRPNARSFHAPSSASVAGVASGPGTLHALGVRLGACPTAAPQAAASDLPRPGTHTLNIDCVVHHQLAGGFSDGTYRPDGTVTRGQVASFLAGLFRTARTLPPASEPRFTDLGTSVHQDAIEALAAIGVVNGITDTTYRPNRPITREQFASLVVRTYERLADGTVRPTGPVFADVVGSPHERNVRVATQLGFVRGMSADRFAPREQVSRGQLATLLRGALDKLVNDRVSTVEPTTAGG